MVTPTELNRIFEKVAKGYSILDSSATFEPFIEIKVRWVRSEGIFRIMVSDYFDSAPADVLDILMNRI